MKLSRNLAIKISGVLDNWLPPVVRDSKLFVYLPFKYLFRDKAHIFFTFKQKAPYMSGAEYVKLYREIDPYLIKRETSLNTGCILAITQSVMGRKVLEVGCGNAYLAKKLSNKYLLTGVDILVNTSTRKENGYIQFVNANAEHLPFENNSFDTTICTHTLEHVLNFEKAIAELRRVTRKRLIIVVPMQKPFKYTFDLHLRFFPFVESFFLAIKDIGTPPKSFVCKNLGGDIFYYENRQ
jgi:SAM-dependent methyltransferase